ncbi:gliding motility-associated-like protein/uncharacterized repeat protein (TIGR01451 family) [Aquimarina sp. EL_43]|uniref:T9SS type B sorting domain-containing protein n=1 Tax=unclassified Aquimarina TaxID=2627091 RepID=UPI0018C9B646|nr:MULTISPECIES: T9SS type B sorting domain-containing protein [unclassified Aquimarina]MBG6132586.1 gliding motility-associated-like protein/uncharacterized repeat protein (TIGR01451 family) [Aquimarina sp. EL_35]MBG6152717.1 gliding motility-associated-like protein/uncharacterized repeat protein (TIGR01451 family) [Aquimarina sp. EL_32]MBG6170724.1 gliding motility-associated-like protein/uncharacterized repeat protein (TIGR01451 family) [Aquimarina sp. EL_43]
MITKYLNSSSKFIIILIISISISQQTFAQVDFGVVPNSTLEIKGELKVIGNAITGLDQTLDGILYTPNMDYDGLQSNNSKTFGYIDIDGEDTFSSSSADLILPSGCEKIAYAGLYWSATYFVDRMPDGRPRYTDLPLIDTRPDFRTVKFKPPGGSYITIPPSQTTVIYDGYPNSDTNKNLDILDFDKDGDTTEPAAAVDMPYVCYADVTDIMKGISNPSGTYTIANVRSATGLGKSDYQHPNQMGTNGISSGWVLVVAYEDPKLPAKYISTRSGYLVVDVGAKKKSFKYEPFNTLPDKLPVNARYSIATLEGERYFSGDILEIEKPDFTTQELYTTPANPKNNFFDSSISENGEYVTARKPKSKNTMGLDIDIFDIDNPKNTIIQNGQTSATFFTSTKSDSYSVFFHSFQIEIIEPELTVTKQVFNTDDKEITGENVSLGQKLYYKLTIENQGNEDIINASIKDKLPINVDYIEGSISTDNSGVTAVINSNKDEINITIDNKLLVKNGGKYTVEFGVQIIDDCSKLRDACSNEIKNVALSTYTGATSGFLREEKESILGQDTCGYDVTGTSNVLVRDDICTKKAQDAFICTGSIDLVAGDDFEKYEWVNMNTPGTIIGTNQKLNVTKAGTYRVTKIDKKCKNAIEIFKVDAFTTVKNPVLEIVKDIIDNPIPNVSGNIRTCTITGEALPELFLCGSDTEYTINSGFTTATKIIWERLDTKACTIKKDPNCPTPSIDIDNICINDWRKVGEGIDYTVKENGEYRIVVTFDANCTIPFYFNVFKNSLDPELKVLEDIVCYNPGTKVGAGILQVQKTSNQHEYELIFNEEVIRPYQTSTIFSDLTKPGEYTVNVRQKNGPNGACIVQATAKLKEFDAKEEITVTSPSCPNDRGQVQIVVTESKEFYTYTINSTGTTDPHTDTTGPIKNAKHTFKGLNPGTYQVFVESSGGNCLFDKDIEVEEPKDFSATVKLLKDLHCNPGYQPDPTLNDPDSPNYDPLALPFDPNEFIAIYKVEVTGGSGNYSFNTKEDFSGITLDPLPGTSYEFRATTAGIYPVFVNDNTNNCTIKAGSVKVNSFEILNVTVTPKNPLCSNNKGAIQVDVSSGKPVSYILDQGTATEVTIISNNTTEIFNNVDTSISHTVTVKDRYDCDFSITNITFTVPDPIKANETIVDITCNTDGSGNNPGSITLTLNGGTPDADAASYTYKLTKNGLTIPPPIAPSFPLANQVLFEGLDFGIYTIEVIDDNLCSKVFGSYEIKNAVDELKIEVNPLGNCVIGSVVDITVINGSGVNTGGVIVGFTIEVIGDPNNPVQALNDGAPDPVPPPTPAGLIKDHRIDGANALEFGKSYTIKVVDLGTNCEYQQKFMLTAPAAPAVSLGTLTHERCVNGKDGGIIFTVDNYNPIPVDLNWEIFNRFATPSDLPVLSGGPVTASGGAIAIDSSTEGGLPPGEYYIRVTEVTGTRLCSGVSPNFKIKAAESSISIKINQLQDETCNPGDDATIEAVVTGGTGLIQYQLEDTGGGPLVPFGSDPRFGGYKLDGGSTPAGIDYVVRVKDARSCEVTNTINIQPPIPLELKKIDPITLTCSDSEDGTIRAEASGGQGSGTYFFMLEYPDGSQTGSIASTTNIFQWNDLKPGRYIVTVTDNLACLFSRNVDINTPSAVTIKVNQGPITCSAASPNPMIVTAGGGTPPYEFSSDGITFVSGANPFTFPTLPKGDYNFYVRDANGCPSPASNTITIRETPEIKVTLDLNNTFIICFGERTGSINAKAEGGLGDYGYRVTGTDYLGNAVELPGPIGSDNTQTTSFFGDLLAGNYTYTVTSGDCIDNVTPFEIGQPKEKFTAEAFETPVTCSGERNGNIRVTASGGTAPYTFSLYNSANLAVYELRGDDIDNLLGEHTFENLLPDTYRVEVEDANGCPRTILDIQIIEPAPILATVNATTPEDCAGDMNGTATLSITGGLPPTNPADPSYFWSIDGVTYQPVTDPANLFIDNLPGGITTVFIRDSQNNANCQGAFNIDIEPGVNLAGELVPELVCPIFDYSDPTSPVMTSEEQYFVSFDIVEDSQGLGIIYTLNGINGTPNPPNNSNLTGNFEVTPGEYEGIMEYQGCTRTVDTIEILEYTPLAIPVAQMTNNPQDPNEYQIIASGGRPFENTPFYAFSFTMLEEGMTLDQLEPSDYTELDGNIFVIRQTADYVLRVVDADGCEVLTVQNLTYINIRIPNYFTPDSPNSTAEDRFWYPRQITPNIDDPFFFENMEVTVFDRYGRMLAKFKGDQQGWDGLYQGKQLPSGDYWYSIILNDVDNREFTGHFTLYR